jgi:SNF2 family DNA or RNA helicase/HJR/Mrr/RecB family endonuclease
MYLNGGSNNIMYFKMELIYKQIENQFSFFLEEEGKKIPISDWEKQEIKSDFLSQIAILNELKDNGLADFDEIENVCKVDNLNILKLSDIDKQILKLPNIYPFEVYITSDGVLTKTDFNFKYGFYDFCPNGTLLIAERNGALLRIIYKNNGESNYLLSEKQYQICEAIDEFNSLPQESRSAVFNLKKLSELKILSKDNGLFLEEFLNNQELFIPEKIKLDIDFKNDCLEIFPSIEIEKPEKFITYFDIYGVKDIYPIGMNDGKTIRVLISENQKPELEKVKKNRKISEQEKIQEIIEHPELFFDEEKIDFTVFYSDRVKEIGIYKPKFYPFVCPYKTEWIPGIVIKDKIEGEKRVLFKTPEVLNEFIEQKNIAKGENKQTVLWENTEIPILDAEKFIETAKKQFENPAIPIQNTPIQNTPIQDNQNNKNKEGEVLIIKENAEELEFIVQNRLPENFIHDFYQIQNLKDEINLKEHQKEGVSWLQSLLKRNFSGGLLADDMGLGKTLQLLYFIEWHCQHCQNTNKPYLIVAPVSLLENWENEYKKFFSPQHLALNKLYGNVTLTKENNPNANQRDAAALQKKQIILTNYETIRSYQISLGLVDFAIIALDEAQKIKTPGTLITNASKALKADFKIAMTGTPVENTLVDIWCLMDFAVPGLLGNAKDFAKKYQNPLKDENTNVGELTKGLRNDIGIFIKRRLKSDVAKDLSTKYDNLEFKKEMPLAQLNRYKQEIELANDITLEGVNRRNQRLKSLWAIRDISDHPYLLDNLSLLNNPYNSEQVTDIVNKSAKLQITIDILRKIKSKNDKVIVFADRKETQKMLQKVINYIFNISARIINGDTPTIKQDEEKSKLSRQQTIDLFQSKEGFNVIIMSPLAAGVGLNVTEANHIIHYSRHWNPAKEEQATDRAYRIGQKKDVFVYYPMAVFPNEMKNENGEKLKSFDEILDGLLNNKKALASNTLFPTEQAEVKPDELFENIFGINSETNAEVLTLDQLDKLNPNLFEAAIALLYKKQGFEVFLTPYSNDKGVDVVAERENNLFLLQVKQSKSSIGIEAIQEIYTAKNYYKSKFNYKDEPTLFVVTNNNFSNSAQTLAHTNGITLINRVQLQNMLNQNGINLLEINKIESQRMSRI